MLKRLIAVTLLASTIFGTFSFAGNKELNSLSKYEGYQADSSYQYHRIGNEWIRAKKTVLEGTALDAQSEHQQAGSLTAAINATDNVTSSAGGTLVKRTIYEIEPNTQAETGLKMLMSYPIVDDLPSYNGYKVQQTIVLDSRKYEPIVVSEGREVAKALERIINIPIGLASTWAWVPAQVLGISIETTNFGRNDRITLIPQTDYYKRIIGIEDKDKRYPNSNSEYIWTATSIKAWYVCDISTQIAQKAVPPQQVQKWSYPNYYYDLNHLTSQAYQRYISDGSVYIDTVQAFNFKDLIDGQIR